MYVVIKKFAFAISSPDEFLVMTFPRISLPNFVQYNSIKANRDHAFFCFKQDFPLSLLWI